MSKRLSCGWVMGVLVAMPLAVALLYWSWCWGGWGRENRLMRYWFQCQCPLASEEARYSDNIDVLVSACQDPYYNETISPSGRYAFFRIRRPTDQRYLYDEKYDSFERVNDPALGGGGFLTDEVNFYVDFVDAAERNKYYLYTSTGEMLFQVNWVPMGQDYSFDPAALEPFRHAERVIVSGGLAIALAPDFLHHPEANFVLGRYENRHPTTQEQIIKIFQANGVKFEIGVPHKANVLLPTPTVYLIGGAPPSPGVWRVPQPLLRQRFPLEELDSSVRPRVEAQRAQEIVDKRNANLVLVIGIVLLIALLGLTTLGAFRSIFGQRPRS